MLGGGDSNSIQRELNSLINGPDGRQDTQSLRNRKIHLKRMKSEILKIETGQLGKRAFQSLSMFCMTK